MKPADLLVRTFLEKHPEESARALDASDAEEAARLIRKLPVSIMGPVVSRLSPSSAGAILSRIGVETARSFLSHMTPQQAAAVYQHLDEAVRNETLEGLGEDKAAQLRQALTYPPDTAGALMDPQVSAIPADLTVQEAIAVLRRQKREAIYYLYVTDRERRLVGILSLRDLVLGGSKEKIESLMNREVVSIGVMTDREEFANLMQERGYVALPVVDVAGRLAGVLKHEQAVDAVQQEAFEDLQKMVGAGGDEHALSSIGTVVKRRLPWLTINLVTAFMAAGVVALFEGVIARVTALAVLLPIVAGQGGNTGAQTLAVVIRGLSLREILPGTIRWLVVKEFMAGMINGLAIAVATAGAVFLWDGRAALAIVIGLAMIVNMASAALSGAAIPVLLRAIGRDPAQSSSIFLTTVTDVVGFGSFLGFALAMERHLN
ncbi:MAG: magnesium transporter [Candidatus Brocadiae bacterium]|nr:magnesium transporter [Candidatus Brocadiia bacterium]